MDENLTSIIKGALSDFRNNVGNCALADCLEEYVSLEVHKAGYRFDPYPSGLTKDDLFRVVATKQHAFDRVKVALYEEHYRAVGSIEGVSVDRHRDENPGCPVCKFLAETN